MGDERRAGLTAWLLLGVIFLLGVAQIAVLPLWEGFDETAHWSSIQQIADTGVVPVYGQAQLSADRLSYFGPEPRGVDTRGRTYAALRTHPPAGRLGGPTRFQPDRVANWQAQHPPLFYLLMTPVYRVAEGLDWVDHLLVLRLACWLMAIVGLGLGAMATWRLRRADGIEPPASPWTTPLTLLWPILFAGFFADQARLGNDSLCLLIFGAGWMALLPMLNDRGAARSMPLRAVLLGLLLGAGLWTKAFFGPISLSVGALLVARAALARRPRLGLDAGLALVIAWGIGAAWYLIKWRATGALTGSDEAVRLVRAGGLLRGLAANFSVAQLARGLAAVSETIGWSGTWSLVRLSEVAMVGVVVLLIGLALGYVTRLREQRGRLLCWAPLVVAAPMTAGLIYHVFMRLAIDGVGAGTPGWYLHVIAPALGLMLALGWVRPRGFAALGAFSILYTAASWMAELSFFSGCTPAADKHYDFDHAACLIDGRVLSQLGHPWIGGMALTAALVLAAVAAVVSRPAWSQHRADGASELTPLN